MVSNGRSLASGTRRRTQFSALGVGAARLWSLRMKPDLKLAAENRLAGGNSDFNATSARAGRPLFLRSNRTLCCTASVPTAGAGKTQ